MSLKLELDEVYPQEGEQTELEELKPMADGISGMLGLRLGKYLLDYADAQVLGWVFGADTDFELPGVGKRRPDVAFCTYATLPEVPRTVIPVPPDLVVEITSSWDEIDLTDKKVKEYRRVGIKLVWVVKPEGEVVEVYRNGKPSDLLGIGDELDGDPLLPGFRLPLSKLFETRKPPIKL